MKHIFFILVIIGIIATGLFLPYLHGDYDYFAVGLSSMTQFASFVSLLLVPIGLIWGLMDLFRDRNSDEPVTYPTLFRKLALAATVIIILFAALSMGWMTRAGVWRTMVCAPAPVSTRNEASCAG